MRETWNPLKQSPVHYKLIEAGAALEEISGWLIAKDFGDAEHEAIVVRSSVGLSDLSSLSKWEIKGSDVSAFLTVILGVEAPKPGRAAIARSGSVYQISRNDALFILDQEDAISATRIYESCSQFGCVHATDRTYGLASFLLCGPQAGLVLRKLTPLDVRGPVFPDLSCSCGPLAAVRTLIARKDRAGMTSHEIFVSREYGEYLWDAVMEAGREFQIRPLGSAAVELLER